MPASTFKGPLVEVNRENFKEILTRYSAREISRRTNVSHEHILDIASGHTERARESLLLDIIEKINRYVNHESGHIITNIKQYRKDYLLK